MPLCSWCLSNKATRSDDERDDTAGPSKSASSSRASNTKKQPAAPAVPPAQALFDTYADASDSDVIGLDGMERLCNDAGIAADGALPLLLAWQINAKSFGSLAREEWMRGLDELRIDSLSILALALTDLQDLLILRKPAQKRSSVPAAKSSKQKQAQHSASSADKYRKDRYWEYAADVNSAFAKFYAFCFTYAKDSQARSIDMEIATALWSVILAPQYPIIPEIIEFIKENGSYRGVNKDIWNMTEEFGRTVKPSLEGYDNEGAWPTLFDDFVAWKTEKRDKSADSQN